MGLVYLRVVSNNNNNNNPICKAPECQKTSVALNVDCEDACYIWLISISSLMTLGM